MELRVEFRKEHARFSVRIKFNRPVTLKRLKKEVSLLTSVERKYIQLFNENDVEMEGSGETSVQNFGVVNGSKVVAKHENVRLIGEYEECKESPANLVNKTVNVTRAAEILEIWRESKIFMMHPQLDENWRGEQPIGARWNKDAIMKMRGAAEVHFRKLDDQAGGTGNSQFTCRFGEHEADFKCSSVSTLAFFRIHGEETETKYVVKCHFRDAIDNPLDRDPDFVELFCYKLLELMGVGPKVHIIPPTELNGTKTNTYIASEWDSRFEYIDYYNKNNMNCVDFVVQKRLIELLFAARFKAEHEVKCGKWKGTQNLAIVHFFPNPEGQFCKNIKEEFLSSNLKSECDAETGERLKYEDDNSFLKRAKMYIDKWNMANNINLAREHFDSAKALKKSYKGKSYFTYNNYIISMENTLTRFQHIFNALVQ